MYSDKANKSLEEINNNLLNDSSISSLSKDKIDYIKDLIVNTYKTAYYIGYSECMSDWHTDNKDK